jgi:glycogen debranching enzyme
LLLVTGRHEDARFIILSYGNCVRHGLIPNLCGEGTGARFNCRDAVWFWLQCIKDYCIMVPHGTNILKDMVARLFPTDDSPAKFDHDYPLTDVIQDVLEKHAEGLSFRERNAGYQLDEQMSDNGFNNTIGVDWNTGFVFGGNSSNCGTWMDKMGSSQKAGNKGKPATPRDGSAVEIVGLCASVLNWLVDMKAQNLYPHDGVTRGIGGHISFKDWHQLIVDNFERHYYIDTDSNGIHKADLINHRGMYKDTLNSSQPYTDYQLRPNFCIALAVAPEIVDPEHAWIALKTAEHHLLGPLGMKTLDSSDYNYNGNYFNSDDSDDYKRAKGFNYHQGPEWVWPIGFFFRAKLFTAAKLESNKKGILKETFNFIKQRMTAHNVHIHESEYKGLPELTNSNGSFCPDSCLTQAWSSGCLLEALYDMELIAKANP